MLRPCDRPKSDKGMADAVAPHFGKEIVIAKHSNTEHICASEFWVRVQKPNKLIRAQEPEDVYYNLCVAPGSDANHPLHRTTRSKETSRLWNRLIRIPSSRQTDLSC